jgi:hypothetical protein
MLIIQKNFAESSMASTWETGTKESRMEPQIREFACMFLYSSACFMLIEESWYWSVLCCDVETERDWNWSVLCCDVETERDWNWSVLCCDVETERDRNWSVLRCDVETERDWNWSVLCRVVIQKSWYCSALCCVALQCWNKRADNDMLYVVLLCLVEIKKRTETPVHYVVLNTNNNCITL